jgi:regulator of protease activity HflC (stomatin/prohibitin superfamily)
MDGLLGSILGLFFIIIILGILAGSIKIVRQSEEGIVERLGRFHKRMTSGLNFLVPFIDRQRARLDMREKVIDFPPQPVITKDNVTMQIDTVVYFQITDSVKYVYEISNPIPAIENLTATTLRNIIGELDLDETLTSRDLVNTKLRSILDEATDKWGIKVNRVELKNIMPPRDIQEAMEKQMRAERERRETILRADGDREAAIRRAEGNKRAAILNAEAVRQQTILHAEAEKEKRILEAQGEAAAILNVRRAMAEGIKLITQSKPDQQYLALEALKSMEHVADGKATKIILPNEMANVFGYLAGLSEAFKDIKEVKSEEDENSDKMNIPVLKKKVQDPENLEFENL